MHSFFKIVGIASAIIAIIVLISANLALAGGEKIPLTTKSEKAKEYFIKGRQLADKLRIQESQEYFQKAVDEDPNFALARLNLAFAQPTTVAFFDSFNKAKALADKASEGERLQILGFEALGLNGDAAAQLEMYQKLIQLYPDDERAHNLLGNHYFGQQKYDKAIEQYEIAMKINPEFSQPLNQLGYAYRFQEDYARSERAFKKYIALIPNDPNPYDSYAEMLLKIGRHDESIKNYEKALQINPGFVNSHFGIASNYLYKGEPDMARKQLQKFYDNAVNDGQRRTALTLMAVTYVDEGRFDDAFKMLDKQYDFAAAISDTSAMAGDFVQRGNVLLAAGSPEKALQYYKKAVDIIQASSRSDEIKKQNKLGYLYNAGRANVAMGQLAEAKGMAEKFSKAAQAAHTQFQIYQAYELNGLIAMAEKRYDDAIENFAAGNPLDPNIIFQLAKAYEASGDKKMAQKFYDKAADFNPLLNLRYAFIRNDARTKMASM
ncbi:MAG: tetratricopeptide repeat protein [Candidatus Zixiibacteriota bacterium]